MRTCPTCQRQFTDQDQYCSTCALADGGPVTLLPAAPGLAALHSSAATPSIAIGEKAVVSGEVIARKEQNIYQGPATITNITRRDDTKVAITCAICGLKGTLGTGFHACPGCGRMVCQEHFQVTARLCLDCHAAAAAVREDIYRQQAGKFFITNGLIDPLARGHLEAAQRSLGISALRAAVLEQAAKGSIPGPAWGPEQQRQLDAARHLLMTEPHPDHAVAYLEPLVQRHPEHQELQAVWLEALAACDPERALAATAQAQVEIPALYLVRARLLAGQGKFQDGLELLADAQGKPALSAGNAQFRAASAEILLHQYFTTGNALFLSDAAVQLSYVAGSQDPYVGAIAAWLARAHGDTSVRPLMKHGTLSDLQARRIQGLMAESVADETAKDHERCYPSHASQRGAVWQRDPSGAGYVRAPQESEESNQIVRTFQRLGVGDSAEGMHGR